MAARLSDNLSDDSGSMRPRAVPWSRWGRLHVRSRRQAPRDRSGHRQAALERGCHAAIEVAKGFFGAVVTAVREWQGIANVGGRKAASSHSTRRAEGVVDPTPTPPATRRRRCHDSRPRQRGVLTRDSLVGLDSRDWPGPFSESMACPPGSLRKRRGAACVGTRFCLRSTARGGVLQFDGTKSWMCGCRMMCCHHYATSVLTTGSCRVHGGRNSGPYLRGQFSERKVCGHQRFGRGV